jgi:hypothetical protein
MIKENRFGSKYFNIPANNIAAEAHLAEGQYLLGEQTLNKVKSLMHRAGTRRPTISKIEEQNLGPR